MPRKSFRVALALLACVGAFAACSSSEAGGGKTKVVASFYPLAWAAKQVGGDDVTVEDLTPKGAEAHDLQLTARQRLAIEDAKLILLLGKGFQPEVERAARDAHGRVVDLLKGIELLPSREADLSADPHVWLDPAIMRTIVVQIGEELADADPAGAGGYRQRASDLARSTLTRLDESYAATLKTCALRTLVTTHEAFGYLAGRYGLTQLGLTGLTPEAEPSATKIQQVRDAARRGEVAAVFYEDTDEGRRIGRSVASDVGVPALPLNTLESDPSPQSYPTQMDANLNSIKRGLRCS